MSHESDWVFISSHFALATSRRGCSKSLVTSLSFCFSLAFAFSIPWPRVSHHHSLQSQTHLSKGLCLSNLQHFIVSLATADGMAVDLMPGYIGDMEDASLYASGPFTVGEDICLKNVKPASVASASAIASVQTQMGGIGRDHMTTFDFDPHYQSCKSSPSSLPSLPLCQERENLFPRTHSLDVFDCRSQLSQRVKQILQAHIGCKCEPLQVTQCKSTSATSVTRQRTKEEISLMADEITKVLMCKCLCHLSDLN